MEPANNVDLVYTKNIPIKHLEYILGDGRHWFFSNKVLMAIFSILENTMSDLTHSVQRLKFTMWFWKYPDIMIYRFIRSTRGVFMFCQYRIHLIIDLHLWNKHIGK